MEKADLKLILIGIEIRSLDEKFYNITGLCLNG